MNAPVSTILTPSTSPWTTFITGRCSCVADYKTQNSTPHRTSFETSQSLYPLRPLEHDHYRGCFMSVQFLLFSKLTPFFFTPSWSIPRLRAVHALVWIIQWKCSGRGGIGRFCPCLWATTVVLVYGNLISSVGYSRDFAKVKKSGLRVSLAVVVWLSWSCYLVSLFFPFGWMVSGILFLLR